MSRAAPAPLPAAVLLCAGGSTRMGRPKPLLPWRGGTLLEAHLAALREWEVVVVTGAAVDAVRPLLVGVRELFNADWKRTSMGRSAQLAARLLDRSAVFVPIDTVPDEAVLLQLSARKVTTVPLDHEGHRGHPLLLSLEDVRTLAAAPEPSLRPFSLRASLLPTSSKVCAKDFDTPAALERMREEVARGGLEPPTPRV